MKADSNNIIDTLYHQFEQGQASHAYVIQANSNNLPALLKQCAMIALCKDNGCKECETCKKIMSNEHLDVITLPLDGRTKLNVDDIEYLVEESIKRPVDRVQCRVFLLNACESLQGAGSAVWQNKLLKTLEEPVGNTYIFIGVDNADSLYQTILSRCQVLSWTAQSVQQIAQDLISSGYSQKSAVIASLLSQGNSAVAQLIMSDNTYFDIFDAVKDMLCDMTSTKNALQFVANLVQYRQQYGIIFVCITVLLRESILYRTSPQLCSLSQFYNQQLDKISDNYSIESSIVIIEKANLVKRHLDNGGNYLIELDNFIADILEVKYRCRI